MTETPKTHAYCFSGSPYVWRALIGLEEKGIPYETTYIARESGEHRSPELLALNPRGRLPIVTHGDAVLYESLAILTFLERRYPEPALVPAAEADEARVWVRMHETADVIPPFDAVAAYAYTHTGDDRDPARMRELCDTLGKEVDRWEGYLAESDGPWLGGETFSVADIALFGLVAFLVRVQVDLSKRWPHLGTWYEKTNSRPSVQKTWPPHWRTAKPWDLGLGEYL